MCCLARSIFNRGPRKDSLMPKHSPMIPFAHHSPEEHQRISCFPSRAFQFLHLTLPLLRDLYQSTGTPVPQNSLLVEYNFANPDSLVKEGFQSVSQPCLDPLIASAYHERMKSTPDPDTTPDEKMQNFKTGLRQVLNCGKTQLTNAGAPFLAFVAR